MASLTRTRRMTLLLASVLVVTLGAGVGPATAGPTPPPLRQLALGVSMWPYDDLDAFDAFATASGRTPAIWSVWSDWGGASQAFPTELMAQIRDRGSVPMVYWQPLDPANPTSSAFKYQRIINGYLDAYITAWATSARDHGGPIILRFAHEMDGYWFPWSVKNFNNTPARFIAAWRHIWNIFRGPDGVGATNVRFLWSPNSPCSQCTPYAKIYPGDLYVDYVGFTAFNWGDPYVWRSMKDTLLPAMAALKRVTNKPVIVAETASNAKGGNKSQWVRDGYPEVYAKWPRIKAIVYFNVDSKTLANQPDWRIIKPLRALDRYRALLVQPRFQGAIP